MVIFFNPLATLCILLFFVGGMDSPHLIAQPLDSGQNQTTIRDNSNKFVNPSNNWSTVSWSNLNNNFYSHRYRFIEDSTFINGNWYFNLEQSNEETGNDWFTYGLFRERDGIVYGYIDDNEYVFFDFNLEVDDRITLFETFIGESFEFIVVSIDTIALMDGSQRKRLLLDCYESRGFEFYWVEGLGSLTHLPGKMSCFIDMPEDHLLCFYENGEMVYVSEEYESCWITSVRNLEASGVAIYPNPTVDQLNIQFKSPPSHTLEFVVLSSSGVEVKTFKYPGHQLDYQLHLQDMQPGIYQLIVELDNRPFTYRFVVSK